MLLLYTRPGGLTTADQDAIAEDAAARDALCRSWWVPVGPSVSPELVSPNGDVAVTILSLSSKEIFRVRPTIEELRELPPPAAASSAT